jgi:hypothetical protein
MQFLNQTQNVNLITELADAINELTFDLAQGDPWVPRDNTISEST